MRRGTSFGTPLGKAVCVQMRVFADLAYRALTRDGDRGTSYAAWTRRGVLVVAARGWQAHELARLLVEIDIKPQHDKPEHLDPDQEARP